MSPNYLDKTKQHPPEKLRDSLHPEERTDEPNLPVLSRQGKKRLSAVIPGEVYEILDNIAKDRQTTLTEVLRHAIGLEKWFHDVNKAGDKIMVKRGSEWKEVIMP
ncbi:MAG: hypothetical protein JXR76_27260 [Deltaproteobacteria bacterium]|nr:hypothetical protein [Deltaproteobacteria bacterium]